MSHHFNRAPMPEGVALPPQPVPQWVKDCRTAYLECALWADWPEGLKPRNIFDCVKTSVDAATADILNFQEAAVLARIDVEEYDAEQVGHDLWLTRNGHGAGFWDRPEIYGEKQADALSEIARKFGNRYPYPITGSRKQWGIE